MKHLLLFISLFSLGLQPLRAQGLSLAEARRQALNHNHRAAQARESSNEAQATLKAARTHYLPKVAASAYALYSGSGKTQQLDLGTYPLPASLLSRFQNVAQAYPALAPLLGALPTEINLPSVPYQVKTGNSYLLSAHLTQPLYTGGKISAANRMARTGVEMATLNEALTEDEICVSTDRAYWQLVEVNELVRTAEAYVKAIDEAHRIVSEAVTAGMRTHADRLRVEVERGKAQLAHERSLHGQRLAQMNLAQIMGLPLDTVLLPSESFPQPRPVADAAGQVDTRPEYGLLQKQVELKKANVSLVRSDFLPQLGLRVGYGYMRGLRINDHLLIDQASPSVMVSLNVPIFSWGEGRAKVKAAQAQVQKAALQLQEMSEKMILEQQQAIDHYKEQCLEVEITNRTVMQTEALLKQTHDRYEAGLDTTAELLEAELIASQARSEHIAARSRLALAETLLQKAMGRL